MSAASAVSSSCNSFDTQHNGLRRRNCSALLLTGALAVFLGSSSAFADNGDDNGGNDNGGSDKGGA